MLPTARDVAGAAILRGLYGWLRREGTAGRPVFCQPGREGGGGAGGVVEVATGGVQDALPIGKT